MARIREPTYDELRDGLKFAIDDMDECLQRQPELFFAAAEKLALLISQRDEAKERLKLVEAEVDEDIRVAARANDRKITEKEVESEKIRDTEVLAAQRKLSELNLEVGKYFALKESYAQRMDAMKVAARSAAERAYQTDVSIRGRASDERTDRAMDAKRAMNDERRRRG